MSERTFLARDKSGGAVDRRRLPNGGADGDGAAGAWPSMRVDVPRLCRQEVERAWHWWHESDPEGVMPLEASFVDYLASRFPEAAPEPCPHTKVWKPSGECVDCGAQTGAFIDDHSWIGDSTPTPSAPAEPTRIPYGQEKAKHRTSAGPCHDCRVVVGQLHVEGCDWEECENCGGQRISCGCCVACHAARGDYLVCAPCLDKLAAPPSEAPASDVTPDTPEWHGCWRHGGEMRIGCDQCKQAEAAKPVAAARPEAERIHRECPKEHWCVLGYGHPSDCRSVPVNRGSCTACPCERCQAERAFVRALAEREAAPQHVSVGHPVGIEYDIPATGPVADAARKVVG